MYQFRGGGHEALCKRRMSRHEVKIGSVEIELFDAPRSCAAAIVARELEFDDYRLHNIPFCAGDLVIDVGGHVGLFAIYLALRFPNIIIHSYEPFPPNCRLFRHNLELNKINNVTLHEIGISSDRRMLQMATNPTNSGGASCNATTLTCQRTAGIPSCTLNDAFKALDVVRCKLLKMDCEGSEHEILLSASVLPCVDYFRAEFHMNNLLETRGYSVASLTQHCRKFIDADRMHIKLCRMSE